MNEDRRKIRVLLVDDSAIVRKMLCSALESESDIEVVGTAPDPYVARDKILALRPDVLTLDIEMPRMDGITFLRRLMHYKPLPVIIISSLRGAACEATFEALRAGAVEVLAKPSGPYSVGALRTSLANKIRAAAGARMMTRVLEVSPPNTSGPGPLRQMDTSHGGIIAIGASTGGTEALTEILTHLPPEMPPILITQHMPPVFTGYFAARLDKLCPFEVKEARDGDEVVPGRALIAPGDFHMLLSRTGNSLRVRTDHGPQVCYQRPAVDVMFTSVARVAGPDAVGALLTGMGADGAQGLLRIRKAGGSTIAQNEESCVVFGMPREAIRLDAAERVLSLSQIPNAILRCTAQRGTGTR
ncbi:MAG TPA: chemotaxis response regulator protein-glutamate methylesterase [Acidobacteriaceae bacterium]|jgi:two-component system chemotaxis response regulator CheB